MDVINQRVFLHVLHLAPAELPLSSISLTLTGTSLECHNRFLIENNTLNGFTIAFPTEKMQVTYLTKTGLDHSLTVAEETTSGRDLFVGLIGQVCVEGIIGGSKTDATICDAQIDSTTLTLFEKNTNSLMCSFALKSPTLAIDGTAEAFVISPDYSTALRITSDSKNFLQAVYQNKATQETATRSAVLGPFIATNDRGFVRIEKAQDRITISVNGSEPAEMSEDIAEPKFSNATPKPEVLVGDFEFRAELPSLEGISSVLHELFVKHSVNADFPAAIARLIGLEGQYLTYCVFGRLAQAHIMLTEALSADTDACLSLLAGSRDKEVFLNIIAQFVGALSRDCETILYYFPSFVVERDKDALSSAGLCNSLDYGRAESCYQGALRTYGALSPHLYRIENMMSRFGSIQRASTKTNGWTKMAPLGVTLAASVIHPFFLIGAVQQGVNLAHHKGAKSSFTEETLHDVFESCAQEWDYIFQTLIPFLSSRFAHEIYPVRLATAAVLLKAYENGDATVKDKLSGIVAQRLGRLISFCEFPSAPSCEISRLSCVNFLMKSQKCARGFEQRPF